MGEAVDSGQDATVGDNVRRREKRSPGRSFARFVRELVIVIVGALVLSGLLRAFVAQPFLIPSQSMENTLQVDDRVVVQKITPFQRGDIVVFKDPGGWLPATQEAAERGPVGKALEFFGILPDTSDDHLIKRVIGVAGDTVACCDPDGRVTVNGKALEERAYLYSSGGETVDPARVPFEAVVPAGHIFVMGDHRNFSADSRCHMDQEGPEGYPGSAAFVPVDKVVGTAWLIVAPFDRWRTFSTPTTFAGVPPPGPAPAQGTISPEGAGC